MEGSRGATNRSKQVSTDGLVSLDGARASGRLRSSLQRYEVKLHTADHSGASDGQRRGCWLVTVSRERIREDDIRTLQGTIRLDGHTRRTGSTCHSRDIGPRARRDSDARRWLALSTQAMVR